MGMLGNILSKLGIGKDHPMPPHAASVHQADTIHQPDTIHPDTMTPTAPITPVSPTTATDTTQTMAPTDVMAHLEAMARNTPETLHWQTSIVDLLKLLGLDSSLSARKELAAELNCPPEKMTDSAQMNQWLHRAVLQKMAENGGRIPPEMLH